MPCYDYKNKQCSETKVIGGCENVIGMFNLMFIFVCHYVPNICYFLALRISMVALFIHFYFDMELIIGIGILELVFLRCN